MNKKRIHLSLAHMGGGEQKYVDEAFKTNWIPIGPNIDHFEEDIANYIGENKYVAALGTGTAALHLSLIMLDIKPGDEVICQSFTFAASANPITYIGAKPVFVDSDETWNISPILLEKAIVDRKRITGRYPKAIIPVYLYGMPAKIDEIMAISERYGIPVVEDAAEALGSEFKGRKCGTFGKYGAYSFNGNKVITTSGGGAIACGTKEEADKVKFYATQARDNAPHYQHSQIGYNYRTTNIAAGIGRGQMEVLPQRVLQRRANNLFYKKYLGDMNYISFQIEPNDDFYSNYWLTSIVIDPKKSNGKTREYFRLKLESENIESRPLWKPMHLQPVFSNCPFYGDGTSEMLFENGLCLPSGSNLSEEDLLRVIEIIKG